MNALSVIVFMLAIIGISAVLIPFLPSRLKSSAALLAVILNAVLTSVPAIGAIMGHQFSAEMHGGLSLGIVTFQVDQVSAWFMLIVNLTLFNGTLYGMGYMKAYSSRKNDLSFHWILIIIFQASMLWVCMLRNTLAFLVVWEIMTLSSLLLVLFDHEKPATPQAGLNYLVQMHIGVAFLTVAFIWIYISGHSFTFDYIATFLAQRNHTWVIILLFAGFAVKAGFVPFHTWLPHAHPAAPSHVSGVMSGVIVKMGIYGILRIALLLRQDLLTVGIILLILSAITTLYGILNASVHRDLKKMLAFCTTENIGIVGMGIGLALIGSGMGNTAMTALGLAAALLHTLNHSLYKSLLFFAAGNVYFKTHTRNMEQLGGLIKSMPYTAGFFLIGSLAIGGLPPFNGFISKFLVYSGFIGSFRHQDVMLSALMILCTAILAMAGGVSLLTFTKAFGTIFLGIPRSTVHADGETSFMMRLPLFIVTAIMLFIGIFPSMALTPVFLVICSVAPGIQSMPDTGIMQILSATGRASLLLILLIAAVYATRKYFTRAKPALSGGTWGCGYTAPTPALQYTGKSFSKSLAKLFGFITIEGKKYNELKSGSIFPSPRNYSSNYLEFFETRILQPVIKQFLRIFGFFGFIHNGKIQLYVLYGFFFVVVLMVLSFLQII